MEEDNLSTEPRSGHNANSLICDVKHVIGKSDGIFREVELQNVYRAQHEIQDCLDRGEGEEKDSGCQEDVVCGVARPVQKDVEAYGEKDQVDSCVRLLSYALRLITCSATIEKCPGLGPGRR